MKETRNKTPFGDFQTPLNLAREVTRFVKSDEDNVTTVVEPTCGTGSFLLATLGAFGNGIRHFGFDINPDHVEQARKAASTHGRARTQIECADFYTKDWRTLFTGLPPGILVIGNPPWVTNAALGSMGRTNLPEKTNFQRHGGLAAKTGKANFDISEWMLVRLLKALQGTSSTLAMLCKTSTARRVLRHAWRNGLDIGPSSVHQVDAAEHFGVSVDACLLYTHTGKGKAEATCTLYSSLSFEHPLRTFGLLGGDLVSDIDAYRESQDIDGIEYRKWRSGVKHDAAKIMEFTRDGHSLVNGLKEICRIEEDHLYPLLKSSDLANGRLVSAKLVLLTQRHMTDNTEHLRTSAPLTWDYLLRHAEHLDSRRSSVYANRPRFSVFGVGPYTFAPWKVAISGLYKNLNFQAVDPHDSKPVVVDDTCYFFPCNSQQEAIFFAGLLNSESARRFITSLVFMDAKRPVTIDVLKRIDLKRLAERLGMDKTADHYLASPAFGSSLQRQLVFEKGIPYRATEST
jgi:hypothetical protein